MLKFLKWTNGRNGSYAKPYEVMSLLPMWFCKLFMVDCVLIRMEPGACIHPHIDNDYMWKGYRVKRTNFIRGCEKGGKGKFHSAGDYRAKLRILFKLGLKMVRFYPDVQVHSVSPVTKGTRYTLSFGNYKRCSDLVNINEMNFYYNPKAIVEYHKVVEKLVKSVQSTGVDKVTFNCNPWVDSEFCYITPTSDPINIVARTLFQLDGEDSLAEWYAHVEEAIM